MMEAWIGLGGVIVGSMITITKDVWLSKVERRRSSSYSAIRLVFILEEYADKCIDVLNDDGTSHGQPAGRTDDGQEYLIAQVETPEPLNFPDDIDWRSLRGSLMHRCLAMTTKARSTNRYISVSAENAFMPDYEEFFEPRRKGYAQLGLDALTLADDMRSQYSIKTETRLELSAGWNPKKHLQDQLDRFQQHEAERSKRLASMPSPFPVTSPASEVDDKTCPAFSRSTERRWPLQNANAWISRTRSRRGWRMI